MEHFVENFNELNSAINSAKCGDIIYLKEGIYFGKLKITKSNITLKGTSNNSIITNKDYYNKIHQDNKEFLTVRTYTVLVTGDNVTFDNITIKNESTPSSIYGQAVALEVLGDNFKCINTRLIGAQDTLLSGPIPYDLTIRYKDLLPKDELGIKKSHQYYENCYIEGDIDFIFGCGISYFYKCTLHAINKGYFAAPSHPKEYEIGFVFDSCTLEADSNVKNYILARPWRDYGSCIFINNIVKGDFLDQSLFNNWTKERENTCRFKVDNSIDTKKMVEFAKLITDKEKDEIIKKCRNL